MGNFIIDKKNSKKTITYMEYDISGYTINIKNSKNNMIKVSNITFYQEYMVNNLLINKYNDKLNKLCNIVFQIINDDDNSTDEGDCLIVLDEIERLKAVLDIKIKKQLTIDKYNEYINQLIYLQKQINNKIIELSYNQQEELTETKGRSR